jgi:hypothetical protein
MNPVEPITVNVPPVDVEGVPVRSPLGDRLNPAGRLVLVKEITDRPERLVADN